jgi:hypothetical protein
MHFLKNKMGRRKKRIDRRVGISDRSQKIWMLRPDSPFHGGRPIAHSCMHADSDSPRPNLSNLDTRELAHVELTIEIARCRYIHLEFNPRWRIAAPYPGSDSWPGGCNCFDLRLQLVPLQLPFTLLSLSYISLDSKQNLPIFRFFCSF